MNRTLMKLRLAINRLPLLIILISTLIAGACGEENLPRVDVTEGLFPLNVGDYRDFGILSIMTVEDTVMKNDRSYFRVSTENGPTEFFREANDKVYRLGDRNGENEVLFYDFALEEGSSWTYKTTEDGFEWTVTLVSKTETFTKGDFVFENCHVFYYDVPEIIDEETTHWLAPGVGLVRVVGQVGVIDVVKASVDGQELEF
ncbi:MAG: hypothetical protein AAFO69_13255 [Bacteroidota bacterium]